MNHPRHTYWRHLLTAILSVAFPALVFFINVNSAAVHAASASNTIVFDRYDSAVQKTKVFVMNADGSNVTELAIGFLPTWSGDGQKIAYSFGNSETFDIWTMNADGSDKTQLTQNYRSFAPAWSPDNSKIAFVSDHEGDYHIYIIDADGQNQRRLNITAAEVVREYVPTWSPDGTKVIFLAQKVVNGLARYDYYESNADGSGMTKALTSVSAVLEQVRAKQLRVPDAQQAKALPGRGLEATVNGEVLALGNSRLLRELGVEAGALANDARRLESEGRTVSWLVRKSADKPELLGLLAFGDTVKPSARRAVERLHELGIRTLMLTGDNQGSALAVARQLGIDEVRAEVLPGEKALAVQELRAAGQVVAMVGDGLNDSVALAAADVAMAMSTGTDVAMEVAGITLMRGDPRLVPDAMDVSRRTCAKIKQNLWWAFGYNVLGIPLAALGMLSPVIAGAAMAFSSVSVVTNALMLRRWRGSADTDTDAVTRSTEQTRPTLARGTSA